MVCSFVGFGFGCLRDCWLGLRLVCFVLAGGCLVGDLRFACWVFGCWFGLVWLGLARCWVLFRWFLVVFVVYIFSVVDIIIICLIVLDIACYWWVGWGCLLIVWFVIYLDDCLW